MGSLAEATAKRQSRTLKKSSSQLPADDKERSIFTDKAARHETRALSVEYVRSVAHVMADVAEAVQHAHNVNILHRDIKPSNVMVDTAEQCWIIDFGLAGYLNETNAARSTKIDADLDPLLTSSTGVVGTPQYMAPEQFAGRADARSDVWGLGATLYELLTLRRPFDGDSVTGIRQQVEQDAPIIPRELITGVPRDLQAICLKALHKDPNQRYQSAQEIADDLRRWQRDEPTNALPAAAPRRAWKWARRNKGWAAAIAMTFATVIIVGTIALFLQRAETARAEETARETKRDSVILELERLRLTQHTAGWSERAWEFSRQAANIRQDSVLRDQAAATLIGLDVVKQKEFKFGASSVTFDPDGKRLLMGGLGDGKPTKLWDGTINVPQTTKVSAAGPVTFTPDGTAVQLVPADGPFLALLNVKTGSRISEYRFPIKNGDDRKLTRAINDLDFAISALTPDASIIAGAATYFDDDLPTKAGLISVWNGRSGKLLHTFRQQATSLAFAPDGNLLAAGDESGKITVWNVTDGKKIAEFRSSRNKIHCLTFHRDRHRSVESQKDQASWLLATGDAGGRVLIWDVNVERVIFRANCRGSLHDVYAIAFSPDGMILASTGRSDVNLWDAATGESLLRFPLSSYIPALSFSPDGKRLVVGSQVLYSTDHGIVIFELQFGRGIETLRGLGDQIAQVAFSPNGKFLAALSNAWDVGIWDLTQSRLLHVFEVPAGSYVDNAALAFSRDARQFAFAAGETASLWSLDTGKLRKKWDLPPGLQDRLVFHPTQNKLLSFRNETKSARKPPYSNNPWTKDPRVCRLRDLFAEQPLKPIAEIDQFNRHVYYIAAAPDGSVFVIDGLQRSGEKPERMFSAISGIDGRILWENHATPQMSDTTYQRPIDEASKFIAILQLNNTAQLLDLKTGLPKGYTPNHVNCLAPQGRIAANVHFDSADLYSGGASEVTVHTLGKSVGV